MKKQEKGSSEIPTIKVVAINLEDVQFLLNFTKDKGFYAKNNINPEFIKVERGTDKILISNNVDLKIGSYSNILGMYLNGNEPRLIGSLFGPNSSYLLSKLDKENIKKAKMVSVPVLGNDGHYSTIAVLKNIGMDIENIKFIAIPNDNVAIKMLEDNKVDIVQVGGFKNGIHAKDKYFSIKIWKESLKGYNFNRVVLATSDSLKNKNTEIKDFLNALYEGLDFIKNNKDSSVSYLQKKYDFNESEAEIFYENFLVSMKGNDFLPDIKDLENMKSIVTKTIKINNSNSQRDLKDFIYDKFVKDIRTRYPDLYR
ncbi:MAG: ABC transporter substrate-binding protein [Candidatus Gracilibacteria bacterium]|nr:ABC transporter substrate-binding protein [Candidatus Gracilibacteria bacterium]